jgi:hypothetical protein
MLTSVDFSLSGVAWELLRMPGDDFFVSLTQRRKDAAQRAGYSVDHFRKYLERDVYVEIAEAVLFWSSQVADWTADHVGSWPASLPDVQSLVPELRILAVRRARTAVIDHVQLPAIESLLQLLFETQRHRPQRGAAIRSLLNQACERIDTRVIGPLARSILGLPNPWTSLREEREEAAFEIGCSVDHFRRVFEGDLLLLVAGHARHIAMRLPW